MTTPSDVAIEPCELLEWDTAFFGFRIARVRGETLDEAHVVQVNEWCRQNHVNCLYFLCPIDDPGATCTAENNGFHLMDVRMTFERGIQDNPSSLPLNPAVHVRQACPEDVSQLEAIAQAIYHDSRFYYDARFPSSRSDALYETWIKLSCEGYAAKVLVAVSEGRQVGFISCHLEDGIGKIGLVGVDNRSQRHGVGQALLASAIDWFRLQPIHHITVVTQGRNYASQRLYQRFGFLTQLAQLWYHKWYENNAHLPHSL